MAATLFNRVRMSVSGAPGTGDVTLLAAVSGAFFSFAEAGVPNGATNIPVIIEDGGDVELVRCTYSSTGPKITRDTVTKSKIGGVAGTTKLTLTSSAIVYIDPLAADIVPYDGATGDAYISHKLRIGTTTADVTVGGIGNTIQVVDAASVNRSYLAASFDAVNAWGGFDQGFMRSRAAAPGSFAAVQNGDRLASFTFYADDGAVYGAEAASLRLVVDGTPSGSYIPAKYTFAVGGYDKVAINDQSLQVLTTTASTSTTTGALTVAGGIASDQKIFTKQFHAITGTAFNPSGTPDAAAFVFEGDYGGGITFLDTPGRITFWSEDFGNEFHIGLGTSSGVTSRLKLSNPYFFIQTNEGLSIAPSGGIEVDDGWINIAGNDGTNAYRLNGVNLISQGSGYRAFRSSDDAERMNFVPAAAGGDTIYTATQHRFFSPTATTNAVTRPAKITIDCSSTPAVGIGTGIAFEVDTGAVVLGATVDAVASLLTGGAEIITLNARQMAAGALQEAFGLSFLFKSLTANVAYTNNNSAQPWFPSGGALSVEGSTSYEFEGILALITTGASTTHTLGLGFGGSATLTSIGYRVASHFQLANTTMSTSSATLSNLTHVTQATNTVVSGASGTTSAQQQITHVRGIVRVNGAGTLIPQFTFSAAPGAGNVLANTFFKLRKLGSNTVVNQGNWA